MKKYVPENNRRYTYNLVLIDDFNHFGWTVPLNNETPQTITNFFENILKSSKTKPNLIKTDDGSEVKYNIFTNLLNDNNIKRYSQNIVFSELRLQKDIIVLLKIFLRNFNKAKYSWKSFFHQITAKTSLSKEV